MDARHLTGIKEIDQQHQEIHDVATSLGEAVASGDKWHLVHYILVRLAELLKFHFAVEESVMRIVAFPEADDHKRLHGEILTQIEKLKADSLASEGLDLAVISEQQIFFLTHILDHDQRFMEYVRSNTTALRH